MQPLDIDTKTGEIRTPQKARTPNAPDFGHTLECLAIGSASLPLILTRHLADCAMSASAMNAKAKLTLTIEIRPGKGEGAVLLDYVAAYQHPTQHGRKGKSEDVAGACEAYVNDRGAVTLTPDQQGRLF